MSQGTSESEGICRQIATMQQMRQPHQTTQTSRFAASFDIAYQPDIVLVGILFPWKEIAGDGAVHRHQEQIYAWCVPSPHLD